MFSFFPVSDRVYKNPASFIVIFYQKKQLT